MAKKKDDPKDAKKDAKSKKKKDSEPAESVQEEVLVATTDLEIEPEEVQFTETSYTSASFESLPPLPIEDPKFKKKKKKRIDVTHLLEAPKVEEQEKKKKGKKGKKKQEENIPDFEKPKTWKKMAKKDRDAWMQKRIEEWKVEMEAEKQAKLAGAKVKRERLARERVELLAKEVDEQDIRDDLLKKAVKLFTNFEKEKMNDDLKKSQDAEWQQYLRCDGLPDPRIVTELNTFLHVWEQNNVMDDNELDKKFIEVLPILEMLEILCANKRQFTKRQADNYDEARLALRAQLHHAIQMASYTLLRDLEKNLVSESTKISTYHRDFKGLNLDLWVAIKWPTRRLRPVEPDPEPVELPFPSMKVKVILSKIIDTSCVCVRAARSMIDLLSENSRSYALKFDMPKRYEDLYTFNVNEMAESLRLKKQQDDARSKFYKEVRDGIRELEAFIKANVFLKNEKEKDQLDNLNMAEPPYMPRPREQIAYENERDYQRYLKSCVSKSRTGELNLRKYRICGGVLNLDLIVTPPQPKRMGYGITVTTLQLPKCLKTMKYQVQYRAPVTPPPGVTRRTPEEIEQEIKVMEAQYEKLAMVFIDLPDDVMWSEPPVVCQWQEARNLWTSNFVNDYKFNEDKLNIQFRTGVLWPIGIATLRYSNMPYQGFDIKPDPDGKGVIITVTGICVTVTWICLGNYVKLKSIKNASTPALTEHFGKKYSVKRMVQLMRNAACDFFPDFDGHTYVEESARKEWVMERHTYHAMAFMSRAYNFQSSRWNQGAGYRTIIMQAREAVDKKRAGSAGLIVVEIFGGGLCPAVDVLAEMMMMAKLQLMSISSERTTILKCVESTTEITDDPQLGLPYFPDLFTFNMMYGSVDARRSTFNMKYQLVETVFEMLQEIKPCSYS